jgi:lysophospholipase L1-like esterase
MRSRTKEEPVTRRTLRLAAAALALAAPAVAQSPSPTPGPISFTSYYSIGDSLAAGYTNNSLVETHQVNSVPALLARQAGVADFQQPLIGEPGIPPEFALLRLSPNPLVAPRANASGAPRNAALGRSYNNLAVPGATLIDALTRTSNEGGFHDIILRGRGTQVQQAAAARPTFITLWIGNNDVLAAAIRGRAVEGVTLTPADSFRAAYAQLVNALRPTGARMVAANLPDVTVIPYVRTIPRVVVNPATGAPVELSGQQVPLLGPNGPLPPGTLVTLAASVLLAQGDGIPTAVGGRGTALPDEVVLDPSEVSAILDRTQANNRAIAEICAAAGIPVLDVFRLSREFFERGRNVGGVVLTSAFLTGGLYGYDGVHPTDLGYAILANEWIALINASGGELPLVDLGPFLGIGGGTAAASAHRGGALPELSRDALEDLRAVFPRVDGR